MLIGPFVNGLAIVIGGLAGAGAGHHLPERLRSSMPKVFGLASMGLGIVTIMGVKSLPAVILSLVAGSVIGELLQVERGLARLGGLARRVVDKVFPTRGEMTHEEFLEQYVSLLVLFCASGTGIFGAMHEGMTGDPSILYVKSILDVFTAVIFAISLGYAVVAIVVPQLAIQLALAFFATMIMPLSTPAMLADFSAVGGLIMLATGFRICAIMSFPVANMLPALLLIMPVSHFWGLYVH